MDGTLDRQEILSQHWFILLYILDFSPERDEAALAGLILHARRGAAAAAAGKARLFSEIIERHSSRFSPLLLPPPPFKLTTTTNI